MHKVGIIYIIMNQDSTYYSFWMPRIEPVKVFS